MSRPIVVQSEHLDPAASSWLAEHCIVKHVPHDAPEFPTALADADALVVRTYTIVDRTMIDAAPRLKVIGRAGVGIDNIDVAACRSRGIEIVYTPDANTQAVVEYVVALLLDVLRPRVMISSALQVAEWNRLRSETVASRQINELIIGVLGLGRVGKGVARVAASIGCSVIYHDLVDIPPEHRHGAHPVAVDELFTRADVISIHIDGRPSNRGFVSKELLSRMKHDVILLNTARGFVVDNLSLASFMRSHPKAIACLDVHDPEPFTGDYPLLGLPNVRLYPHLASRTATAMANMSWVVRDVLAVLEGRQPQYPAP